MRAEKEKIKPKGILKQPKKGKQLAPLDGGTFNLLPNKGEGSSKRKRRGDSKEIISSSSVDESNEEDLELQDFFDSVENDNHEVPVADNEAPKTEMNVTRVLQTALIDSSPTPRTKDLDVNTNTEEAKLDNRLPVDDIEQVAYEARLAKLLLLTRQKRSRENGVDTNVDDTAKEVGAALDMTTAQETEMDNQVNNAFSVAVDTSALRDILKKKRKKSNQVVGQGELDEEDAYWSNY